MTPSRGARRRRLVIASGFAIATMGALVILIGSGSSGYARAAAGKATAAQYQYGSGNPRPGTAAKLTSYRLPDGIGQPSGRR